MMTALLVLLLAAPPVELPGTLVIVGGGGIPDAARDRFFNAAGKDAAKIIVVPTASVDADDAAKNESYLSQWKKLKPASVVLLHTRDRKVADTDAFVEPLKDATAVWFSGGDQSKITAAYRGTKTEAAFKAVFARGGVLGGTSAGAAIMTDPMIAGGKEKPEIAAGFGFLPGFITDQHFTQRNREPRSIVAVTTHPGTIGLGIDEATAVVVKGRTLSVVGEGNATIILGPGGGRELLKTPLKNGQTADLFQLRRAAENRAAKEPFPPKKLAEPVVPKGTLVIVGGAGMPEDVWKAFLDGAGGAAKAKIVAIPTSAEDPVPTTPGEIRALKRLGVETVTVLHTRDRKLADDPKFSEALLTATGVWYGGGRQWRFVDAYEGTLTEKRIRAVLDRGGVIGGSSAGASIQSEYMPRGHPLGNVQIAAEGYERGFGYLPGCAVDQHFYAKSRLPDMTGLMKLHPQFLGIGIDEATAIVVTGGTAKVIGKSKVAFYDANRKPGDDGKDYEELTAGQSYDLKARKILK